MYDKQTVLDYLWSYSRFHSYCLQQSEELYRNQNGFSAITVLFSCLENISKSVVNDYESNLFTVFKKLLENKIVTQAEHDFLNTGENCIRKIRNLYAHANIAAINLVETEDSNEILWPLTEDETSLLLYEKISDLTYNLIIKLVSFSFIEDVKQRFFVPLDEYISKCNIKFKKLSVEELLVLKGFPPNYIPDDLGIPEDTKYRIVDNASDVNMYTYIFSGLKETGLIEALKDNESVKLKQTEETD